MNICPIYNSIYSIYPLTLIRQNYNLMKFHIGIQQCVVKYPSITSPFELLFEQLGIEMFYFVLRSCETMDIGSPQFGCYLYQGKIVNPMPCARALIIVQCFNGAQIKGRRKPCQILILMIQYNVIYYEWRSLLLIITFESNIIDFQMHILPLYYWTRQDHLKSDIL